jgi:hypothetical protein
MHRTVKILIMLGLIVAAAFYLSSPECFSLAKEKKDKGDTQESEKPKKTKKAKKDKGEDKSDKKKAEDLHSQAVEYYKNEKYEEALEYFKQADELSPNPVTMFNMGRCYEKLGKYKEAYELYKKYIESGDPSRLNDAEEAMSRIEQMPIKLKVVTDPKDAEVFVDGKQIKGDRSPFVVDVSGGQHTLFVRKDGYESDEEELDLPYGTDADVAVALEEATGKKEEGGKGGEGGPRLKKTVTGPVPISIHLGLGATVSTSKTVTSYMDATLGIAYRIKDFSVGIGLDNMFFTDSYLLAGYPTGAYTLKLPKGFSMNFSIGFGAAYLYSSKEIVDSGGQIVISSGHMWDLVAHADVKLRYKVGPVLLQAIPLNADVFIGVGSIDPAPLAQFAFLLGIACDF